MSLFEDIDRHGFYVRPMTTRRVSHFRTPAVQSTAGFAHRGASDQHSIGVSGQQMVGQAMVRTGAAILMVPDPLPLVDEVVGGALVVGGAVLTLTA